MADASAADLLAIDRDVARGHGAWVRWRDALAAEPEDHADDEPLEIVRYVAGKSAWEALRARQPSAAEARLRDALVPWVYALTQARIAQPDTVAWARAVRAEVALAGGERSTSWRDAWRGVVAAKTPGEASLFLEAAAQAASSLTPIARSAAARRLEVARRFGVEHPWSPFAPPEPADLRALARQLLDRTEDLSRAVWGPVTRGGGGAAAVIHAAVAREAGQGWPARVSSRWLYDVFPEASRGPELKLPALPAALGAASFARALYALGGALRAAASPGAAHALVHHPTAFAEHRLGFVFASLAADPHWHERALRVGRRVALAQARTLARTLLLEARLQAARVLLCDEVAFARSEDFEELGPRLFGRPLDPRLRGAWPATRGDDPARLVAFVTSQAVLHRLRERFDVDWFRNPRAWSAVRASEEATPEAEGTPAAESADLANADALAVVLERALG
jgi:hypothetical protein